MWALQLLKVGCLCFLFNICKIRISHQQLREADTEQKELKDLIRALGGDRLPLCNPCMEGTRLDILQQIETGIKSADGHNVIWIRRSPGAGKSALAASIVIRLQKQNRHVMWFRYTIYHGHYRSLLACHCLWLAHWHPSLRQQLSIGSLVHPTLITFSRRSLRNHYSHWFIIHVNNFRWLW